MGTSPLTYLPLAFLPSLGRCGDLKSELEKTQFHLNRARARLTECINADTPIATPALQSVLPPPRLLSIATCPWLFAFCRTFTESFFSGADGFGSHLFGPPPHPSSLHPTVPLQFDLAHLSRAPFLRSRSPPTPTRPSPAHALRLQKTRVCIPLKEKTNVVGLHTCLRAGSNRRLSLIRLYITKTAGASFVAPRRRADTPTRVDRCVNCVRQQANGGLAHIRSPRFL
ncbi:hypothetical protein FB451DRAFT_1567168 [Mycena latifolia]|nr:hypothetical protein FB451DRAFT_1567168 [Mycena latifolia]